MKIVKNEPGKLPYGSYTKKDHGLSIFLGLVIGLVLGGLFIFGYYLTKNFFVSLLVICFLGLIIVYIIVI